MEEEKQALGPCIAYKATIIHSIRFGELEVLERGCVGVADGKILFVVDLNKRKLEEVVETHNVTEVVDFGDKIILPGLVDCHLHAPQYVFAGTGMDLQLLEWLDTYTFPAEAKFKDAEHARTVYEKVVARLVSNGTTTASYFATIHLEACKLLVDIVKSAGQRALVGKVNMDRNSKDYYVETCDSSVADTATFVEHVLEVGEGRVVPVITPRFVPTCTPELMTKLGELAAKHDLPIQSHLAENKGEIAWVADLHPECSSYADVYKQYGLLNSRTYMAHCCYCTEEELDLMKEAGTGIVHCANSNFSLESGILNVRHALNRGLKVGLGTDIAGGYSPSILESIRVSLNGSRALQFSEAEDSKPALNFREMFHLATVGGAEVLGLADKIGNFVAGKAFDAMVVDAKVDKSPFDVFEGDSVLDVFQKFLYIGDDRNIVKVFVQGSPILDKTV